LKLIALKKEMGFTVPYMFLNIETAKTMLKEAVDSMEKDSTPEQTEASKQSTKEWQL